jgi:hypothetical protein
VLVGVEVVHDDVEAGAWGIAGPQPGEDGEKIIHPLPLAHLTHKAVRVDVVEGEHLLRPLEPPVGRPEALGLAERCPAATGQRS